LRAATAPIKTPEMLQYLPGSAPAAVISSAFGLFESVDLRQCIAFSASSSGCPSCSRKRRSSILTPPEFSPFHRCRAVERPHEQSFPPAPDYGFHRGWTMRFTTPEPSFICAGRPTAIIQPPYLSYLHQADHGISRSNCGASAHEIPLSFLHRRRRSEGCEFRFLVPGPGVDRRTG
jgi:hypothetical protein